jgi:hypothetical protein
MRHDPDPHRVRRRTVDDMARIVAEMLALYLEQAGFVVMKRPAVRAYSTSN